MRNDILKRVLFILLCVGDGTAQTLCHASKNGLWSDTTMWTGAGCAGNSMVGATANGVFFETNGFTVTKDAGLGTTGNGVFGIKITAGINTANIGTASVDSCPGSVCTLTITSTASNNFAGVALNQWITFGAFTTTATWLNGIMCKVDSFTTGASPNLKATICKNPDGTNPLPSQANFSVSSQNGSTVSIPCISSYDGVNVGTCPVVTNGRAPIESVSVDSSNNLTVYTTNTSTLATGMSVVFRGVVKKGDGAIGTDLSFMMQTYCTNITVTVNVSIVCAAANWFKAPSTTVTQAVYAESPVNLTGSPAWKASTVYLVGQRIYDGLYDHTVTTAGTSGASVTLNQVQGGTTTDNTVTWTNSGASNLKRGYAIGYFCIGGTTGAPTPGQCMNPANGTGLTDYWGTSGSGTSAIGTGTATNPGNDANDFGYFIPVGILNLNYAPSTPLTVTSDDVHGWYVTHPYDAVPTCVSFTGTTCTPGVAAKTYVGGQVTLIGILSTALMGTGTAKFEGIAVDFAAIPAPAPYSFQDVESSSFTHFQQINVITGTRTVTTLPYLVAYNTFNGVTSNANVINDAISGGAILNYVVGNTDIGGATGSSLTNGRLFYATASILQGSTFAYNAEQGLGGTQFRNLITFGTNGANSGANATVYMNFNYAPCTTGVGNSGDQPINYTQSGVDTYGDIISYNITETSYTDTFAAAGPAGSPTYLGQNLIWMCSYSNLGAQGVYFVKMAMTGTAYLQAFHNFSGVTAGGGTLSSNNNLFYVPSGGGTTVFAAAWIDHMTTYPAAGTTSGSTGTFNAVLVGDSAVQSTTNSSITNSIFSSGISNGANQGTILDKNGTNPQTYLPGRCPGTIGTGVCYNTTMGVQAGYARTNTTPNTYSQYFCGSAADAACASGAPHPVTTCDNLPYHYCDIDGTPDYLHMHDPTRVPETFPTSGTSRCAAGSISALFTSLANRWNGTQTISCSIPEMWNWIAAGYMPQDLRQKASAYDGLDRGFIQMWVRRR